MLSYDQLFRADGASTVVETTAARCEDVVALVMMVIYGDGGVPAYCDDGYSVVVVTALYSGGCVL